MKISGGALSGWYVPDVGDNRVTKELKVKLKGATAGEYRTTLRGGLLARSAGGKVDEAELSDSTDETLIRANVTDVDGMKFSNESGAALMIGGASVEPGQTTDVKTGPELVDALKSAGDAELAILLLADIGRAIRSKAHLQEGLIPT